MGQQEKGQPRGSAKGTAHPSGVAIPCRTSVPHWPSVAAKRKSLDPYFFIAVIPTNSLSFLGLPNARVCRISVISLKWMTKGYQSGGSNR